MSSISVSDRLRLGVQTKLAEPLERHLLVPLRRIWNARRPVKPIFIAGASGSGTSFLTLAIAERFDCAGVVYESDAQIDPRSFLAVPPLDSFGSVRDYQDYVAPRDSWQVEQGRADLLDLCRSYCTAPGDRVLVKGPDINLLRVRFLARCFPDADFVAIFRDPVANVEGYRRKWPTFGDDTPEATICFYHDIHERFLDAAGELEGRIVAVEYESLIAEPDAVLGRIGERLRLTPSTRLEKLPTAPNFEGKGVRNVRNNKVGVVTDANARARARLDPEEAARIETALAPIHARLLGAPFTIRSGAA